MCIRINQNVKGTQVDRRRYRQVRHSQTTKYVPKRLAIYLKSVNVVATTRPSGALCKTERNMSEKQPCRRAMSMYVSDTRIPQVRLLEADNKAEPEVLDRWKGEREKAERESAKANVAYITIREIVHSFKEVPEEQQGEESSIVP